MHLATGGMAEVYLARERGIVGFERLVVLKHILGHLAHNQAFVDMFLREARFIARLSHPNVVEIYDLGEENGRYYIVLEYIHGTTVRELQVLATRANQELPIEVCCGLILGVSQGLHTAHELTDIHGAPLGLVHRDLTPHNIMCTAQGTTKLLDFGVAKATESQDEGTFSGDLKGKFSYMSPEQCLQDPLDRRSDLFTLGIVWWELLTGRRLFKRTSNLRTMQAVTHAEVPPPSHYRPEVPPALDALILSALERDRDRRPPNAAVMGADLTALMTRRGWSPGTEPIAAFVTQIAAPTLALRQSSIHEARASAQGEFFEHLSDDEELPTVVTNANTITESQEGTEVTRLDNLNARPLEPDPPKEEPSAHTPEVATGAAPPKPLYKLLAGIFSALLALPFAAWWWTRTPTYEGPTLTIGWAPTVDPAVLKSEVGPLHEHLSRALKRNITLVMSDSYGDLAGRVMRGEVDFAMMPPLLYVRTKKEHPKIEALAIKTFDGAETSDGLLLVRGGAGSPREVEELRGKRFCLTDKNSTTGNFLPRAYLLAQGHNPAEFIGEIHWSGDHLQVLRDLLAGKCDAAATYSGAFLSADKLGLKVGTLRQFAITGHIPQDAVVAGPGVPASLKANMRAALLQIDPQRDFGVVRLGETQRVTGFVPAGDGVYEDLRRAVFTSETPHEPPP